MRVEKPLLRKAKAVVLEVARIAFEDLRNVYAILLFQLSEMAGYAALWHQASQMTKILSADIPSTTKIIVRCKAPTFPIPITYLYITKVIGNEKRIVQTAMVPTKKDWT